MIGLVIIKLEGSVLTSTSMNRGNNSLALFVSSGWIIVKKVHSVALWFMIVHLGLVSLGKVWLFSIDWICIKLGLYHSETWLHSWGRLFWRYFTLWMGSFHSIAWLWWVKHWVSDLVNDRFLIFGFNWLSICLEITYRSRSILRSRRRLIVYLTTWTIWRYGCRWTVVIRRVLFKDVRGVFTGIKYYRWWWIDDFGVLFGIPMTCDCAIVDVVIFEERVFRILRGILRLMRLRVYLLQF